ncbi:tyrosine-type recombinase/integrase [Gemmatimonadota bacterium]
MSRTKLPVVLEKDEAEAILTQPNTGCPTGLRNRAILEVMYRAGLRVSEVINLKPGDIRWNSGILEVRGGKGGKDRNVPVDSETLGWLRAWQGQRPGRRQRFFTTLQGKPLSPRYLQQLVKRLAHKAGLERADQVTPHVFRHTYATELLNCGFTIREVQTLLGHANVSTTQIYTHISPQVLTAKIRGRRVNGEGDQQIREMAKTLSELPAEAKATIISLLQSFD